MLRTQPAVQRDKLTELIMSTTFSAPAALESRVGQLWARVGAHLEALVRDLHHVPHRAGGSDRHLKTLAYSLGNRRCFEGRSGHWHVRWRRRLVTRPGARRHIKLSLRPPLPAHIS